MKYEEVVKILKAKANKKNVEGMAKFGINSKNILGVSKPVLKSIAKKVGKNHKLALKLWDSNIHEARILAGLIAEPAMLTEKQMEKWVKGFNNWDVCDSICGKLFDKTDIAWKKAIEWTKRKEEFVKRAGFVLMAVLAVHDKKTKDKDFEKFFSLIKKHSTDERNFVKKAVNWALRQMGKRSLSLNKKTINLARKIKKIDSKSARWIANDALRELTSEKTQKRIKK